MNAQARQRQDHPALSSSTAAKRRAILLAVVAAAIYLGYIAWNVFRGSLT